MDIILKAVLNKVAVWKQMYANHEATADEINDRNWHGMCVVLTDRISELEAQLEHFNRHICKEADLEKQLEAVRLLPEKWRKSFGNTATLNDCANELKAAIGEVSD